MIRQSLIAEWAQLRPNEPMPIELQNLFIYFANAPALIRPLENQPLNYVSADSPSPQRFQRRTSSRRTKDKAQGPSKAIDAPVDKPTSQFGAFSISLPLGPEVETVRLQPKESGSDFRGNACGKSYAA